MILTLLCFHAWHVVLDILIQYNETIFHFLFVVYIHLVIYLVVVGSLNIDTKGQVSFLQQNYHFASPSFKYMIDWKQICFNSNNFFTKRCSKGFRYRELNPGHLGESQVS